MRPLGPWKAIAAGLAAVAVVGAAALAPSGSGGRLAPRTATAADQLTTWRPSAGFAPLSDEAAARHVQRVPEVRRSNARANAYVPGPRALRAFRRARDPDGHTPARRNPYLARVTGHFAGTTDEIIQWAAWKWGIPEDWLRAQYVNESGWRQSMHGDLQHVGLRRVGRYPRLARVRDHAGHYTGDVWESLGISQVKWRPDGSVNTGSEPLRWKSTAFAADYEAATVRFFYDDPRRRRSEWGDASYAPGDPWLAIGGWFEPYPWGNQGQRDYVAEVQQILAARPWDAPGF